MRLPLEALLRLALVTGVVMVRGGDGGVVVGIIVLAASVAARAARAREHRNH